MSAPLGNTVGPAIPFVGIVTQTFDDGRGAGDYFGPPAGAIWGKYAVGAAPEGSTRLNLRLLARAMRKLLGWRLTGRTWPPPFCEEALFWSLEGRSVKLQLMRKQKRTKLSLNKETITRLTDSQMLMPQGGGETDNYCQGPSLGGRATLCACN